MFIKNNFNAGYSGMPIIPTVRRLRKEDFKFQVSLAT
jgi:hypothetical protein